MVVDIIFYDIQLEVHGIYTKGEEGTMYHSDLSGTPPTSDSFDIEAIYVGGIDIINLLEDKLEQIEELIYEKIL